MRSGLGKKKRTRTLDCALSAEGTDKGKLARMQVNDRQSLIGYFTSLRDLANFEGTPRN